MKKYNLLILILFTILFSCKSSYTHVGDKNANYIPYYLKVNEADSLHLVGNYKQSQHILDSLFKKFEPLRLSFYNEYFTYYRNKILLNDFDKMDVVLKKVVSDYGFNIGLYLKDSLNSVAMKKAKFTEQDLKGFYESYVKSLNLEYRTAIEKMIENDQRVRLSVPRNKEEWEKVDKENAETIKKLIAKYGYPSIKKIGPYEFTDKSSNISTLFLHASKEERENYILDLMLESVKKGECEPNDFANVYDKYLYVSGEHDGKVLYGELRDRKKSIDMVVLNPKKIDSIRKSIGLEHLDYKRWKFKKLTGKDLYDQ
jgi:hypothetical protein